MYSSNRVTVFNPKGQVLKEIIFPAYNVTCTTWGGRDFDILYVTSARDKRPPGSASPDDEGGHMFRYKPGIGFRGEAKYEFAG